MAESNRSELRYVEETVFNTFPGGTMKTLRMTSESLSNEITNIVSGEINADRMISDVIQTGKQNTGGFNFELSRTTFDAFMLASLFTSGSVITIGTNYVNGTTLRSFSIEKAMLDVDQYILFKGNVVNTFSLALESGAIATGSFGFLGCEATLSQTAASSTITAPTTTNVMNCGANVSSITESAYGGTLADIKGIYIQELSFTINNNCSIKKAIGYNTARGITVGHQALTGTLNAHFADEGVMNKFINGTSFQLKFKIKDPDSANYYNFFIPKAKIKTGQLNASGQDQDMIQNFTWQALRDDINGDGSVYAHIVLSRTTT